jgi:hypothetical protein
LLVRVQLVSSSNSHVDNNLQEIWRIGIAVAQLPAEVNPMFDRRQIYVSAILAALAELAVVVLHATSR